MQYNKKVPRVINWLERAHTVAILVVGQVWELYHFYLLLFSKH